MKIKKKKITIKLIKLLLIDTNNTITNTNIINTTTTGEEKRKKIVIGLSTLGRILKFLKTNSLTKNYHRSKRDYNNNQRNKKTRSRGLMFASNHQRSVRPKFAETK